MKPTKTRKLVFSGWYSGTSFAAPFVTCAAAVLAHQNPKATPAELRALLFEHCTEWGGKHRLLNYGA